jgi:hypothetical protein
MTRDDSKLLFEKERYGMMVPHHLLFGSFCRCLPRQEFRILSSPQGKEDEDPWQIIS